MTETDLAEVALRVIERTDLSDDQFSNIVDEVTETYPREIDWPDTIEEDND